MNRDSSDEAEPVQVDYRQQYQNHESDYHRLREEMLFALDEHLRAAGIKVHSIVGRVKAMDSFVEKIERKMYADPFAQMDDMVGLRVVALFLSDLESIANVIRSNFSIIKEEDHMNVDDESAFGYMSMHYVVAFGSQHSGPRYDNLKSYRAEIQVRTILMDAWANVSHHLDYKGEASIPTELRRDFFALSGLFYVADRHFQLFFEESEKAQAGAASKVSAGDERAVELNLDTVQALLAQRWPDRGQADRQSISELVEELSAVGYETLGELEDAINRGLEAALQDEKVNPPYGEEGRRFTAVGMVRRAVTQVDSNYEAYNEDPRRMRHLSPRARER